MNNHYYVYIMTNERHTVLYIGVTNDLQSRVGEHKGRHVPGFTKRYNLSELVYYEVLEDPYSAITREKQLKGGSRQRKVSLINGINPEWADLSSEL